MKTKLFLSILCLLFILAVIIPDASAQCAMCRGSLESSVSQGNSNFAAGINKGILYLLLMPYTLISIIAFLWYKSSKANQLKVQKIYQRLGWKA
ncbi:MAG: hypothetical protein EAZ08_12165 [Cytophagales bacterium]|nr:MAG: hypothetical protein EAZ08_12165 [Cytophagales bacterium]